MAFKKIDGFKNWMSKYRKEIVLSEIEQSYVKSYFLRERIRVKRSAIATARILIREYLIYLLKETR